MFYKFLFLILYVLLPIIGSGSALDSCESATRYSATFLRETATATPLPYRESASCGVADRPSLKMDMKYRRMQ